MKMFSNAMAVSMSIAASAFCLPLSAAAENASELLRDALRQQSATEISVCTGVQRSMATGADPTLVVRTVVELGYNSCNVIRCALGEKTVPDKAALCEQVIRGAVAAGVPADVISRCSTDVCDPDAVAAILAATELEPNYCYFTSQRLVAPAAPPPLETIGGRAYPQPPPQASPFTF